MKVQEVKTTFTSKAYRRLVSMQTRSGYKSMNLFVRDAIRYFAWFLDREREGYKIVIMKDGVAKEVEFERSK